MQVGDRVKLRNGVRGLSSQPQRDKTGVLEESRLSTVQDVAEPYHRVHFGDGDLDNGWYPTSSLEPA
jgi:hypothetical protein